MHGRSAIGGTIGVGKNLKWLPEMAFKGFYISEISGGTCPQTPLATRGSGARFAASPHKFLATAMQCTIDAQT